MAVISLSNVSKSFGITKLFDNISFNIEDNHKIGLVGVNGSGKTTLFKIICGEMNPDDGEIFKAKNTQIGYVEQFTCKDVNTTVLGEILTVYERLIDIERELKDIEERLNLGDVNQELINKQHKLNTEYEENGGFTYRSIARSTLIGLGFTEKEIELNVNALSGGQKTKLTLAKLLLSNSNLLLLDEPTNNLDISSIEWLEEFLVNYKGSYLVISHDRYFLDKVTNETFELEGKRLTTYSGNYTKYLSLKQEGNDAKAKKYNQTQKEINRVQDIIAQQVTWSQERNYKIIKNKQKMIDRLEDGLEAPDKELEKIKFKFNIIVGGNKEVLIVKELSKSFGNKKLFDNLSLEVLKKEKVFLIGANGCGKTTLLKIIQGMLEKDSGYYHVGDNVVISYYSQIGENLDENKTILDFVWGSYPSMSLTDVRKALARFLFKGEDVNKQIAILSGGEKARILLLMIMLSKSNFLILDEPTNHLDIYSREALEEALLEYEGTMLIVSHDRYFINKLANKLYEININGAREYKGNYDFYIANKKEVVEQKQEKIKNISYKERKEQEAAKRKMQNQTIKLEKEINELENYLKELEEELMKDDVATDYQKAMEVTEKIDEVKKALEEKYEKLI